MNWIIITLVFFLVIGIAVFTIMHNQKDKKKLEEKINNDYPKRKKERDKETEA